MGHSELLFQLTIILATAAGVALVFHTLRQPVIVGYIVAGSLIGPNSFYPLIDNLDEIQVWADLGVVFLMFHLGLEFSFQRLAALGWPTALYGIWDVGLMSSIGWLAGKALGFQSSSRLFLAGMVAISSTTVIMKAFADFGLKTRHFADRVTGLLILEDLAAIIMIVGMNSYAAGRSVSGADLAALTVELFIVVGGWILVGGFLVPRFMKHAGRTKSEELLILSALGLCLILATMANTFQYSMALGAFIMGSLLNETTEGERIAHLVRPLRDLFAAVFFVSIGMLLDFTGTLENIGLVATIAAIVIFGKFLVLTSGGILLGVTPRSATRIGLSMGQVGEFSFLIAAIGVASKKMNPVLSPTIIAVSVITAFTTPYLIKASDRVGRFVEGWIPVPWRAAIDRHGTRMQRWSNGSGLIPNWFKPGSKRLLANSVMVALIFGGTNRWIEPRVHSWIAEVQLRQIATVTAALLLAAPFIVGMMLAARRRGTADYEAASSATLRAFTYILFTFILLGWLSALLVSAWVPVLVTLVIGLLFAVLFSRRLVRSYSWIEKKFVSGLADKRAEVEAVQALNDLAPWDAHLVRLHVHPNARVAGMSLQASDLKRLHGIIIISIRRGQDLIAMPPAFELLLPQDELLMLGTDDEIENVRALVEAPDDARLPSHRSRDYELRSLWLNDTSPLVGATIASSQLREKYGALIVGLERDAQRVLNPPIEMELRAGDRLWLVGSREELSALER